MAESLGQATVNLRVYFWLNGQEYSYLKVRSSVIRLLKGAYQKHGISMPDEAREVIFPNGVPVTMIETKPGEKQGAGSSVRPANASPHVDSDAVSTEAETGLHSEADVIKEQAREAQPLQEAENLLPATPDPPRPPAKHS